VPDTWGISQGFYSLTDYHLIQQLGTAGSIWLFSYWREDGEQEYTDPETGQSYTITDAHKLAVRHFLEGAEAFRAICQEYKIDPAAFSGMYELYDMLLMFTEAIARRLCELQDIELTGLEETKQAYRMIVEKSIKDWE
jgi:hypothetical protein